MGTCILNDIANHAQALLELVIVFIAFCLRSQFNRHQKSTYGFLPRIVNIAFKMVRAGVKRITDDVVAKFYNFRFLKPGQNNDSSSLFFSQLCCLNGFRCIALVTCQADDRIFPKVPGGAVNEFIAVNPGGFYGSTLLLHKCLSRIKSSQ